MNLFFLTLIAAMFADSEDPSVAVAGTLIQQRRQLVEEARHIRITRMSNCPETGTCLYDALAMMIAAKRRGIRLVPQAGSTFWRAVRPELDDGVCTTHFGYKWEPHSSTTRQMVSMGMLPEMHVWLGDPKTQELIDITSGQFPTQAKNLIGIDWRDEIPPDFLWIKASSIPDTAIYEPDREATLLAAKFMEKTAREYGLKF